MKEERGYLTVEATIALTSFLFFMMFIMNMGQVYQAQNHINHSLLQAGKLAAFSSYTYENEKNLTKLGDFFKQLGMFGGMSKAGEMKNAWKSKKYGDAVKLAFQHCAGGNSVETDDILKKYGLENGAASIDFSGTTVRGSDLVIRTKYRIKLPFGFFGITHIDMHQQVVCGLWK